MVVRFQLLVPLGATGCVYPWWKDGTATQNLFYMYPFYTFLYKTNMWSYSCNIIWFSRATKQRIFFINTLMFLKMNFGPWTTNSTQFYIIYNTLLLYKNLASIIFETHMCNKAYLVHRWATHKRQTMCLPTASIQICTIKSTQSVTCT